MIGVCIADNLRRPEKYGSLAPFHPAGDEEGLGGVGTSSASFRSEAMTTLSSWTSAFCLSSSTRNSPASVSPPASHWMSAQHWCGGEIGTLRGPVRRPARTGVARHKHRPAGGRQFRTAVRWGRGTCSQRSLQRQCLNVTAKAPPPPEGPAGWRRRPGPPRPSGWPAHPAGMPGRWPGRPAPPAPRARSGLSVARASSPPPSTPCVCHTMCIVSLHVCVCVCANVRVCMCVWGCHICTSYAYTCIHSISFNIICLYVYATRISHLHLHSVSYGVGNDGPLTLLEGKG